MALHVDRHPPALELDAGQHSSSRWQLKSSVERPKRSGKTLSPADPWPAPETYQDAKVIVKGCSSGVPTSAHGLEPTTTAVCEKPDVGEARSSVPLFKNKPRLEEKGCPFLRAPAYSNKCIALLTLPHPRPRPFDFFLVQCSKEESAEQNEPMKLTNDPVYIDLSNTQELLLDLEVSGDEEGAQIILPPAHALKSELLRNSSTERAIYRYAPDHTYLGADSVFIERCRGGQGVECTQTDTASRPFSRSSPEAHLAKAALCILCFLTGGETYGSRPGSPFQPFREKDPRPNYVLSMSMGVAQSEPFDRVGIVVDQMRADYLDRFRPLFGSEGF